MTILMPIPMEIVGTGWVDGTAGALTPIKWGREVINSSRSIPAGTDEYSCRLSQSSPHAIGNFVGNQFQVQFVRRSSEWRLFLATLSDPVGTDVVCIKRIFRKVYNGRIAGRLTAQNFRRHAGNRIRVNRLAFNTETP